MITVTYKSIDGCRSRRKFKTIEGARKFAIHGVGATPEFGSTYAVSGDGIGKVTVEGCTLRELFGIAEAPLIYFFEGSGRYWTTREEAEAERDKYLAEGLAAGPVQQERFG